MPCECFIVSSLFNIKWWTIYIMSSVRPVPARSIECYWGWIPSKTLANIRDDGSYQYTERVIMFLCMIIFSVFAKFALTLQDTTLVFLAHLLIPSWTERYLYVDDRHLYKAERYLYKAERYLYYYSIRNNGLGIDTFVININETRNRFWYKRLHFRNKFLWIVIDILP